MTGGTASLHLRDVSAEDLPVLFVQQLDEEATRMAAFPSRSREAFDAHWAKILADGSLLKKAIVCDGEVAGNVVCFGTDGERQVGYWLGREHWGRGIATRALRLLLENVPHRPLRAHVAKHNVASRRVLEKCGFEVIGDDVVHVGDEQVAELVLELRR